MKSELNNLLLVSDSHVSGILEKYETSYALLPNNINLTFHFIRFQNELPRTLHFVNSLCSAIPSFCLNRKKLANITPMDIWKLWVEAKAKLMSEEKTGEPGEIIVYFLLEGFLKVPKILSKMSLKTNPEMPVHGSDGIHLGIDGEKIVLYFGESKLWASHTDAITDALKSISKFVDSSDKAKEDFEINLVSDYIDIPDGTLKDLVINTLDPYSDGRDNLVYKYACFIGFDMSEIKSKCKKDEFLLHYQKKVVSCYKNVIKKIENDSSLKDLSWEFFFIPFDSVDEFRTTFLNQVKS